MLPLLLLSQIAVSFAFPTMCDLGKIGITDGYYSLTDGGHVGSIVEYTCPEGTYPYPEDYRECLPNGQWTDEKIQARCSGDTDRKIKVETGGDMNIFIIIDASRSVGKRNYDTAKKISEVFIEKMASFDFVPRYGVISYASFAKPIMLLSDDDSNNAEAVIEKIKKFHYLEHDDKQGTNTRAALREVYNMMSLQHARDAQKFLQTRNVIVLMTDGKHNMGGDPTVEVKRIRELLDIKGKKREDFLDIYVFGLGDDVSENEINDIASKKYPQKHVFKMSSIDDMKEAFDKILDYLLDESEILQMCGLSQEPSKDPSKQKPKGEQLQEQFPWIAKITITRPGSQEKCKGSIVSRDFILTAAHCFHLDERLYAITIRVGDTSFRAKDLFRHPKYNPLSKQDKNVVKSFDYDLALIQLDKKMTFSRTVRPICLPCTNGTTWALKQRGKSVTCSDHEKTLLPSELQKALFIAEEKERDFEQKNVLIKRGNARLSCLEDTKKIEMFKDITDIKDLITDNFLCTGGTEPQVDPQTCKGDAGGPLIVQYKQRFIQVGVISWGTINSCNGAKRSYGPVPELSRDFHADLFHMLDWIKKLIPELDFMD